MPVTFVAVVLALLCCWSLFLIWDAIIPWRKEDDVEGESSPMKSFAKVGIVPADDGRITLVISASESPSLLGAKVRVRSPGS